MIYKINLALTFLGSGKMIYKICLALLFLDSGKIRLQNEPRSHISKLGKK